MSVRSTSIEAYHSLKEQGKISQKRSEAFNALKEYAESEETHRWPTAVELFEWAEENLSKEEFSFYEKGNFKPRITELTTGSDASDHELVEYKDEKREQDSERTDQKAAPIKIIGYQSTLDEDSTSAELREDKQESRQEKSADVVIHYPVHDGRKVEKGSPETAIRETSDISSVLQSLQREGLVGEYRELLSEHSDVEVTEDGFYKDASGQRYLFPPGDEEADTSESEAEEDDQEDEVDEEDDEGSEKQSVLMEDGEVIG